MRATTKTAFFAALILAGCTTSVAPQAEKIAITRTAADVANCRVLGNVEAPPPYIWPGDDLKQMKNAALALGADTIFVTRRVGSSQGVAYKCGE